MKNLVSFWRAKNRRDREGRAKGEKKRKKMEESRSSKPRFGTLGFCMETHLDYEFYEIWHGYLVLHDYYLPQTWGFARVPS